jgi:lysine 2,3-aminomutase
MNSKTTTNPKDAPLCLVDQEEEPPSRISSFFTDSAAPALPVMPAAPLLFPRLAATPPRPRVLRMNPKSRAFRSVVFPDATDAQWADWHWQVANRIRTPDQFRRLLTLSAAEEQALAASGDLLPAAVTPHYMGLVSPHDPAQPLRRTVVPTSHEAVRAPGEADDPLGEEHQSPVPGLVHRYPDRVLLLATSFCSTYCRYCTRSRVVGQERIDRRRLEAAFDYLRRARGVRDVLVSGGDPLTLEDDVLEWILASLRAIPHVEIVRLGTKVPAVLPQRVTPQLARLLRKFHPLWLSLHFTHPDECGHETQQACERLADAGIPLGSQTVLLKGINDDLPTMKALLHALLRMRVRPYYLYQCDPITGSRHFRTPIATGQEIIRGLRGHTTGYAVPTYVIDAPGGGGKIPVMPDYVAGRAEDGGVELRNYEGRTFRYPDGAGE